MEKLDNKICVLVFFFSLNKYFSKQTSTVSPVQCIMLSSVRHTGHATMNKAVKS